MRFECRRPWSIAALVAAALLLPGIVTAQDRNEQIRQAQDLYDQFQVDRARQILRVALDPNLGEYDQAWAEGVHLLAQIYMDEQQPDVARAWLRWAARLSPDMRVDSTRYTSETLREATEARLYVQQRPMPLGIVEQSWDWVRGRANDRQGQIEVAPAGLGVPLNVSVGTRSLREGSTVTLDPSSYQVDAGATGFRGTSLTTEVLPGIITVLRFRLQTEVAATAADTTLPPAVAAGTQRQMVSMQVHRIRGASECRAGFIAGSTFVVTSYEAIRGADSVLLRMPDGTRVASKLVAAYNKAGNVAVLKLPQQRRDSLVVTMAPVSVNQPSFAFTYPACQQVTSAFTRLTPYPSYLGLSRPVASGAAVGAVVDRTGGVVGLITDSLRAVPNSVIQPVLDDARRKDRAAQLVALADVSNAEERIAATVPQGQPGVAPARKKKGFPVVLVLAGVAAAGAGAFVLMGGGEKATTGSITVSVPNQ